MRDKFKLFFRDNLVFVSVVSSIFALGVTLVLGMIFYPHIPPLIPIFNSMPWGEQRLASSSTLFFFPFLFVLIPFLNYSLAFLSYSRYTLASRILCVTSALFAFLGFFAYLQILLLVF